MEYITTKEAAQKWDISQRRVQKLCEENRIPGVKKIGRASIIPANAEKPSDGRQSSKQNKSTLLEDFSDILSATTIPMPINNPDKILDIVKEDRLQLQYKAELAYLRGNFKETLTCFQKTKGDDLARLRICPISVAATISLGDYPSYTSIDAYLRKWVKTNKGNGLASFAELALATGAVSIIAPNMAPDWLKTADFTTLPLQAKANAFFLRSKYFLCLARYDAILATVETALSFSESPGSITVTDIYLRVMRVVALHGLGNLKDAKYQLLDAMNISLHHGFITPFAEVVTTLGGLVEQCLGQSYPEYYNPVINQWDHIWKNWIGFHNAFTKDNITTILTPREYHLALLVARRIPYTQIAEQHCISVGRLKNIMHEIYEKLFITNRDQLAKHIF